MADLTHLTGRAGYIKGSRDRKGGERGQKIKAPLCESPEKYTVLLKAGWLD